VLFVGCGSFLCSLSVSGIGVMLILRLLSRGIVDRVVPPDDVMSTGDGPRDEKCLVGRVVLFPSPLSIAFVGGGVGC